MKFDILSSYKYSQCDYSAILKFENWNKASEAVRIIGNKPYTTENLTIGESGAFQVGPYVMLNVFSKETYLDLIQELRDAAPGGHPEPAGGIQDTTDTIDSMDSNGRFHKVPTSASEEIFDILDADIETQQDFDSHHEALDGLAEKYLAANFPEAVFTGTSIELCQFKKILKIAFSYGEHAFVLRFKAWDHLARTVWLELVDGKTSSVKVFNHAALPDIARELVWTSPVATGTPAGPNPEYPPPPTRIGNLEARVAELEKSIRELLKK